MVEKQPLLKQFNIPIRIGTEVNKNFFITGLL